MPLTLSDLTLADATADDAPELLVLQRCCWVTEALVNESLAIPALLESLDDVVTWVGEQRVWTLRRTGPVQTGRLVGAVRAQLEGDAWDIGRLMVAPDLRGSGIGRFLLETALAATPPEARRSVLFTGAKSERNIRMYEAAGFRLVPMPPGHTTTDLAPAVVLERPA